MAVRTMSRESNVSVGRALSVGGGLTVGLSSGLGLFVFILPGGSYVSSFLLLIVGFFFVVGVIGYLTGKLLLRRKAG